MNTRIIMLGNNASISTFIVVKSFPRVSYIALGTVQRKWNAMKKGTSTLTMLNTLIILLFCRLFAVTFSRGTIIFPASIRLMKQ